MSDLPKELDEYSITQDEDSGRLDISKGKHYTVFAEKENNLGRWYFVHTDKQNSDGFWWMPAALYEVVDNTRPAGWVDENTASGSMSAYPSLYVGTTEEQIIDGEEDAIQAYLAEVANDSTFPTQGQLDEYNSDFYQQQRAEKYEEGLKLARERGYERPDKPEQD